MTDKQFQKAIDKARIAFYHRLLKIAEDEYEKRYNCHPSDVDDDEWIDSMHLIGVSITVSKVEESVKIRQNENRKTKGLNYEKT
jgi:hypothetical protein